MSTRMSPESTIEARLAGLLANTRANGSCKIWNGTARDSAGIYGRVCLSYPGPGQPKSVQTSVSRAVYVLDRRKPDILRNSKAGDVSHRCNDPLCIEPTHLTLERREVNDQRRTCHRDKTCLGCIPPCIIQPVLPEQQE